MHAEILAENASIQGMVWLPVAALVISFAMGFRPWLVPIHPEHQSLRVFQLYCAPALPDRALPC